MKERDFGFWSKECNKKSIQEFWKEKIYEKMIIEKEKKRKNFTKETSEIRS